jgi:hypothetical protein
VKVSDLAAELGVPPSTILEQCQRFGIDAAWAGAELAGADLVVLRAELAGLDAPLDLRPADAHDIDGLDASDGDGSVGGPSGDPGVDTRLEPSDAGDADPIDDGHDLDVAPSAALPPTSAASMPEAAGLPEDASAPASGASSAAARSSAAAPGPGGIRSGGAAAVAMGGAPPLPGEPGAAGLRRPQERRLDRSARSALVAAAVGVVALAAAEVVDNPWAIAALWLLAAITVVMALWSGNRGRRHVQTHPERTKGLPLAFGGMALAVVVAIVLGLSVSAVIGDDPAADATLGDRDSVASARWGYQRLKRIEETGWKRPAKDAETCWVVDEEVERDVDRFEVGTDLVDCRSEHTVEIVAVYAFDRDADSPFPGVDALQADASRRCGELVSELLREGDDDGIVGALIAEHPTAEGWERADRDIACAVVTAERRGSLLDG